MKTGLILVDIQNDYFPAGSNLIAVHTGGLQGLSGFADRL